MYTSSPSPYDLALDWIMHGGFGTGSASKLAKLILSLYNETNGFALSECIVGLDAVRTKIALDMCAHYARVGEDEQLREVGALVVDKYPHLWEMGAAMAEARANLNSRWVREEEKRIADEERNAS